MLRGINGVYLWIMQLTGLRSKGEVELDTHTPSTNAYNQITEQNSGFDRFGNPTQVKDLTGVTTTIKYDQMGREFFRYSQK